MHKIEFEGRKNIIGIELKHYREKKNMSLRKFSLFLKENGLDWDKNAVNRAELGIRVVSDIEFIKLVKIIELHDSEWKV